MQNSMVDLLSFDSRVLGSSRGDNLGSFVGRSKRRWRLVMAGDAAEPAAPVLSARMETPLKLGDLIIE